MSFQLFRIIGVFVAALALALFTGYSVAVENYTLLAFGAASVVFLFVLLSPGYVPLIAFGLLSPFNVPLPFVWGVPPVALVIGICLLKRSLWRGLVHAPERRIVRGVNVAFALFFGWIAFRYCLNPVAPNAAGYGENVTGFRPYLNYGVCFGLVFTIGNFVRSTSDLSRLARWMAGVSIFFILLLVPLMFTRSFFVANVLQYFGLYVTTYDNGIFRFVALPGFGIILLALGLLPELLPVKKTFRFALLGLGMLAILLGGSRSGLVMATAVVVTIPVLRRNFQTFAGIIMAIIFFFIGAYFYGERLSASNRDVGLLRVLTLINPQLAAKTHSAGTWEFREIRWKLAMQEIKSRPFLGKGYGGVQNAFVWSNWSNVEESQLEIDLATGGVHNGYLACALAFGIPAALFFIAILVWAIWRNAKRALRLQDPFTKGLHAFICVNLIAYALTIYIGTDLNSTMIWFFLGLGVLAERISAREVRQERNVPVQSTPRLRVPFSGLPLSGNV